MKKKFFSYGSLFIGMSLMFFSSIGKITGNVTSDFVNTISSFFGLGLIVVGTVLFLTSRKNLESIALENNENLSPDREKIQEKKEEGDVAFQEYLNFLVKKTYNKVDTDLRDSYIHDFNEYMAITNKSEKNKYLQERVNEINKKDIDRAKEIREIIKRKNKKSKVKVLFSEESIRRSERDDYIRENIKRYADEINRISQLPLSRPTETIGDFRISPRGRKNERVAWRYKKNSDNSETIFIDDFLYHESNERYVDNWNIRVRAGEIKKNDYKNHKEYKI